MARRDRDADAYPFPIPAIRDLVQFDLGPDLTLLAAENGRANQILVEAIAIAIALGFNARRP
jgi:predicted ATPase